MRTLSIAATPMIRSGDRLGIRRELVDESRRFGELMTLLSGVLMGSYRSRWQTEITKMLKKLAHSA
jgi:hypothetical protein